MALNENLVLGGGQGWQGLTLQPAWHGRKTRGVERGATTHNCMALNEKRVSNKKGREGLKLRTCLALKEN